MNNNSKNIVSAVFDSQMEAERAVSDLQAAGFSNSAISVIAQHEGKTTETDGSGAEAATDVIGKTALGAGIGTALGVAALAIPGVGPLVAAGAIASIAVPGAALTGAAIGAAAGGLAGLLTDHGINSDDATYYEGRINGGGVFVSVDLENSTMMATDAQSILDRAGGHNSTREKMGLSM